MEWINELKPRLSEFLNSMQDDDYSYFKYSFSGDLYSKNDNWGLANLVYATKILAITGLVDELNQAQKKNLSTSILSFTKRNGYINDSFLTDLTVREKLYNIKWSLKKRKFPNYSQKNEATKRAETRQSFAALNLLGQKPLQKFSAIPSSEISIDSFLSSFDWSRPWAAGSHFSHLMFFLRMNNEFFSDKNIISDASLPLIRFAEKWINKLQSPVDGCWYEGETTLQEKVNGAMKVLTGLHAAGIYNVDNAKRLIDTALSATNDEHACNNFNVTYVLYGASKVTPEYRKDEIRDFLISRLEIYRRFYWSEFGGFSFEERKANTVLYGKKITCGLAEPDIHGTIMFVWGISIINEMLELGLDWKIPLN